MWSAWTDEQKVCLRTNSPPSQPQVTEHRPLCIFLLYAFKSRLVFRPQKEEFGRKGQSHFRIMTIAMLPPRQSELDPENSPRHILL